MTERSLDVPLKTASWPADPLPEMPLAAEQITAGQPVARGTVIHQSKDKKVSCGYWTCTEGEFDWVFQWDEFVHVFEGEVTITDEYENVYSLGPNDSAHFPSGLKTHWHVKTFVRKYFVLRTPEPFEL